MIEVRYISDEYIASGYTAYYQEIPYRYITDGYINIGYVAGESLTSKLSMRQYDNSPILQTILTFFSYYFDTSITDYIYNACWNINTCSGIWLDIWGRKVGVSRTITLPVSSLQLFGFNNSDNDWLPFNQGVFNTPYANATNTYNLEDDAYRLLILAKAASNITNCTAHSINNWLEVVFVGRGDCYCKDTGNMTAVYYFYFPLQTWEITVLTQASVLPRPVGVNVSLNVMGVTYSVN